ncbi:cytochrome c oxidase subunit 7A2b [Danio rerio]|uniref:Cytochrome c oxidase subunit 7A2, mitochondrial n=1 Tax=Danio rerio TaxID=7955 RepID=A0A2R8Q5H6_DANRE|nr:cytochrome c oxidase subunit 7A2b [Danio rerio]|eukprot:XP_003200816.1 cytochrome c oxidase subunit 7A2, mitochondrial [Danio rerio]
MFQHFLTLQQVSRRQISSTVRRHMANKVPDKQKLFQEANGVPVHLKGGVGDAVLYRATMSLTVVGTVCVIYELLKAAVPQKKA